MNGKGYISKHELVRVCKPLDHLHALLSSWDTTTIPSHAQASAEQYFESTGETWRKWAFYDPDNDESWRIYKVGTWIVDAVMNENNLTACDLNDMTAEEILKLWN